MTSARAGLLEIGLSHSHGCRLILKSRFTKPLSNYLPSTSQVGSLKMILQLSYSHSKKVLHGWRSELKEVIFGATVCVSMSAFILTWDVSSCFHSGSLKNCGSILFMHFSIETKCFGIVETELPGLASLRCPQPFHF